MPLITEDGLVADTYHRLDEVNGSGDLIVALDALAGLAGHKGRLGADVPNTTRLEDILPHLDRLDLISLPFPAFTDGRAYSLARQIRQAGFSGELRATGNLLPDQLQAMAQVGFTSFEVSDRFAPEVWLRALRRMSLSYQAPGSTASHVWQERASAGEAGEGLSASAR